MNQPTYIRGMAATWSADGNGTKYDRGAFERSVRLFAAGRLQVPLLLDHDFDQVAGDVLELRAGKNGLEVTAVIAAEGEQLKRIAVMTAAGPLGLSTGMAYAFGDCDRRGGEIVIRDGILREVSLGTLAEVANQAGGPVYVLDQVARSTLQPMPTAGHVELPQLCERCATGLMAAVARPHYVAFDQVWHCAHRSTTVQANVREGRVVGWHFLSPVTAAQHSEMMEQRQRAARSI